MKIVYNKGIRTKNIMKNTVLMFIIGIINRFGDSYEKV